jgi:hypothetical protein
MEVAAAELGILALILGAELEEELVVKLHLF